ncbi:hypothetical protein [Bacillus pumilus]|uniref:hypothetical protein n=1 Tax=Bacillus pumilus TaxID=1408 RepID=UPI003CF22C30
MIHLFVKDCGIYNVQIIISSTIVILQTFLFQNNSCGCLIHLNSASFSSVINIDQFLQMVLN